MTFTFAYKVAFQSMVMVFGRQLFVVGKLLNYFKKVIFIETTFFGKFDVMVKFASSFHIIKHGCGV